MFFTYFNRMRSKSGFSLIELVIVIAIIAIMTAVAVPNFIASQQRAEGQRQNEHARGFYFAVQNMLLNTMEDDNTESEFFLNNINGQTRRRSSPIGSGPTPIEPIIAQDINFYLSGTIGANGRFTTANLSVDHPRPASLNYTAGYTFSDANCITVCQATCPKSSPTPTPGACPPKGTNPHTFRVMLEEIEGYLTNDGEEGHYYVMFDSKFRVTVAYYSKHIASAMVPPAILTDAATVHHIITRDNLAGGLIFGSHPPQYSFQGNSFMVNGNAIARANSAWWTPITFGVGGPTI